MVDVSALASSGPRLFNGRSQDPSGDITASITINGASHEAEPDERLVRCNQSNRDKDSSGLLSSSARSDSNLRYVHRGSERQARTGLWNNRAGWHVCVHGFLAGRCCSAGSLQSDLRKPSLVLYRVR